MNARTLLPTLGIFVASLATACGHEAVKTPEAPQTAQVVPRADQPAPKPHAVSPNVRVDQAIYELCHLDATSDTEAAPKFAYDASRLTPADHAVLAKIATCLTTGPLKGRGISLTGRADPRGTDEYNMALGEHRAHTVRSFLVGKGVAAPRIGETSRGSLDATGTDESSYRTDRRVDIALKSSS